jgi:hypothetical protein
MSEEKRSKPSATVKTSKGLRDTLFFELDRLRRDEITPQKAREVSRVAQQILGSIKLEIEAARFVNAMGVTGESTKLKDIAKIPIIEL